MNVIFDLGNVLIAWDLYAGFDDLFDSPEALDDYLDSVGFFDWNSVQDRGRSWTEAADDLRARLGARAYPAVLYPARHDRTIRDPIEGSWQLAERLAARGHALYALTNWSAELFPHARRLHPRLAMFRHIVVSGQEGIAKPDPAIYRLLMARGGLTPESCVFIDDNAANVAGARVLGMDAILFTDPAALERELTARGLLG